MANIPYIKCAHTHIIHLYTCLCQNSLYAHTLLYSLLLRVGRLNRRPSPHECANNLNKKTGVVLSIQEVTDIRHVHKEEEFVKGQAQA